MPTEQKPEFLSSVQARTGLESPQIVLEWEFDSPEVPFVEGLPWLWEQLVVRRSKFLFPPEYTEGDAILSEDYSNDLSTSLSDITVDGLDEYYYSLFFRYSEVDTPTIGISQNIERLGLSLTATHPDDGGNLDPASTTRALVSEVDGVTTVSVLFDSALSTFISDGVCAGMVLEITKGGHPDLGFHIIDSVVSETQLSLTVALTGADTDVTFNVFDHHQKFWIAGNDYTNKQALWRWNTAAQVVDMKIDLSGILAFGEEIKSIAHVGDVSGSGYISIVTQGKFIRLPYDYHTLYEDAQVHNDSTGWRWKPETSQITNSWTLSNLEDSHEVGGAYYNVNGGTVSVLDILNKEIRVLNESDGSLSSTIDISPLPVTDDLRGLCYKHSTSSYLVGNLNYVYEVPAASGFAAADVLSVMPTQRQLIADFGAGVNIADSLAFKACTVNELEDLLQTYENVWSLRQYYQPQVPFSKTVALYHLDEEIAGAVVDSGPNSNNATTTMTQGVDARFGYGVQGAAAEVVDVSAISGDFDGQEGGVSFWFKAEALTMFQTGTHRLLDLYVDASNYIRVSIVSGVLTCEYVAGATVKTIAVTHPLQDTEFHNYTLIWSLTNDKFEAYFDLDQFGTTQTSVGTWAGSLTTATLGSATDGAAGTWDEMHLVGATAGLPSMAPRNQQYQGPNKSWAQSGRDYDAY